jgi:NAD(P)-dependent dehydrogenase (short-subunit alcohol dehydrogenase family)
MESFTKFAGLEGAVALVTGGATGIGSAIVENFLRQGSRVVFLDKNADAARELIAGLAPGAKIIPESDVRYRCGMVVSSLNVTTTSLYARQHPRLANLIKPPGKMLYRRCLRRDAGFRVEKLRVTARNSRA